MRLAWCDVDQLPHKNADTTKLANKYSASASNREWDHPTDKLSFENIRFFRM